LSLLSFNDRPLFELDARDFKIRFQMASDPSSRFSKPEKFARACLTKHSCPSRDAKSATGGEGDSTGLLPKSRPRGTRMWRFRRRRSVWSACVLTVAHIESEFHSNYINAFRWRDKENSGCSPIDQWEADFLA
jgi:hypothetical protein